MLAVLGVLTVAVALAAAVTALVYQAATRSSEVAVDETGVRELRVTGVTGGTSVTTRDSTDGGVSGTARLTTSWNEAEVTLERQGDVLLLEADCDRQDWPRRCEIDYDLVVDPDTDVVVDLVTGGFEATGLSGDVDVDLTTGGVLLSEATSQRVDVSVTTGGVALQFVEPPTDVVVSTVTGGIGIGLPDDGEAYAVNTDVSVGGANVGVRTDPSSRRAIEAATTVGGIEVGYESVHVDMSSGDPFAPGHGAGTNVP